MTITAPDHTPTCDPTLTAAADTTIYRIDQPDYHIEPSVLITPELAAQWLARNTRNRNPKTEAIGRYAEDMRSGNWRLNGEAIKFSRTGVLLDGQNRLLSCMAAGKPFLCSVVFGLEDKVQDSMDGSIIRNLADVLSISYDVKNSNIVAGVVSGTLAWSKGVRTTAAAHVKSSRAQHIAWFVENRDEVAEATKAGVHIYGTKIGLSPKEAAVLWWSLSKIDKEEADDFFDKLGTGVGLTEGHPILHLRKKLLSNAVAPAGRKMPPSHKAAFVTKAWNLYRDGEQIGALTYLPGGKKNEKFPEPR